MALWPRSSEQGSEPPTVHFSGRFAQASSRFDMTRPLSSSDQQQGVDLEMPQEREQVNIAIQWLQTSNLNGCAKREGRPHPQQDPCPADPSVLATAVMRAVSSSRQHPKRQITATDLETLSGEFFENLARYATQGGANSPFATLDVRRTGTLGHSQVTELVVSMLSQCNLETAPVEAEHGHQTELPTTSADRMKKLLSQRELARSQLHSRWAGQAAVVERNAKAAANRKQRQLANERERSQALTTAKKALAVEVDQEFTRQEEERQLAHSKNERMGEETMDRARRNAAHNRTKHQEIEANLRRKFRSDQKEDHRKAAVQANAYRANHQTLRTPKDAGAQSKHVQAMYAQLQQQQEQDAQRAAAQKSRQKQTQQILIRAMYASSREAALQTAQYQQDFACPQDDPDELCAQLRFSSVKTTLPPVDELSETSGTRVASPRNSITSEMISDFEPEPLPNPVPLLAASLDTALQKLPMKIEEPARCRMRPKTGGSKRISLKRVMTQAKRPHSALGYQDKPPKASDPVADKMRQILHQPGLWSPFKEGENTHHWSPQRKQWAWVPKKPHYIKRNERTQGRNALDHGFVLDSVGASLSGRDSTIVRRCGQIGSIS